MDKPIVIIGGGTAGWLTAYYLLRKKNYTNVTIVDSTKIGILGAGEGSTPILKKVFIEKLGLEEKEFISKVNGTKKYGIDFIGWNSNTDYKFTHGFELSAAASYNSYAYHFDATLFANYLKSKTLELGGVHIDKVVTDVRTHTNKVNSIIFSDNTSIDPSFVFDCTGFKRLVIGKALKSSWVSYKDQLLVDSALPFTIKSNNNSEFATTSAIASQNGWTWKIPLQNRFGLGYVYSSNHASEEEIRKEIFESYPNVDIKFGNVIEFESGYYKKVAIGNTIAVGLSTGFLEPLEATSIATTVHQLINLPENLFTEDYQDHYNTTVESLYEQCMLFIRHHYYCNRLDSRFWNDYNKLKLPTKLSQIYSFLDQNTDELTDIIKPEKDLLLFKRKNYELILRQNFHEEKLV